MHSLIWHSYGENFYTASFSYDEVSALLAEVWCHAGKVHEGMLLCCWKWHWSCSRGQSPVTVHNKPGTRWSHSAGKATNASFCTEIQTRFPTAGSCCHIAILSMRAEMLTLTTYPSYSPGSHFLPPRSSLVVEMQLALLISWLQILTSGSVSSMRRITYSHIF